MKTRFGREAVKAGRAPRLAPACQPAPVPPSPPTPHPPLPDPRAPTDPRTPPQLPASSFGQGSQQTCGGFRLGWRGEANIIIIIIIKIIILFLISSASCIFWQDVSLSFRPLLESCYGSACIFSFFKSSLYAAVSAYGHIWHANRDPYRRIVLSIIPTCLFNIRGRENDSTAIH